MMTAAPPLEFRENVPLAPYVSFRGGGPARWFCAPSTSEHFAEARRFARARGLPCFMLGNGSNLVISDHGFPGLVIHTARFAAVRW